MKQVLVTGGNSGIGFALCKLLVDNYDCHVYLGSRSYDKGIQAVKAIKEKVPQDKGNNIELLQIDVCNGESIVAASKHLSDKNVSLYGLVNNAGVGIQTSNDPVAIVDTNFYGPKRVTDSFLPLLDQKGGRIVNVSSGAASKWVRDQDAATQQLFSSPSTTWNELESAVQIHLTKKNFTRGGYGLSKAGLTSLTMIQARENPGLVITSLSPGFIDTPMTAGSGARLTPEQGCVSSLKCLFGEVTSGWYYGSDGLRSPLTVTRDPGTPEYQGEENPDAAKYNK